ncbi:hypothetical protein MMB17_05550 [Methylobacterium organophilum]|uniref:hypothetical protein n=1 Tax=Methylobacterium organophilum TaxID=410 RepID=UPI001F128F78|nr:hypothetical protein [Methylobacterium organophilum]UMY18781.1 hypothetical protein MMB17_05550 [Methylobacterium organophilum]
MARAPKPPRARQISIWDILGDPGPMRRPETPDPLPAPPAPRVTWSEALKLLVEAGLTEEWRHWNSSLGCLQDPDAPDWPRSIGAPVMLVKEDDGTAALLLSTPATGDFPSVRRVEAVTGLKAVWRGGYRPDGASLGQWQHANDLATDEGWQQLVGLMEYTTLDLVKQILAEPQPWRFLDRRNLAALKAALGIEDAAPCDGGTPPEETAARAPACPGRRRPRSPPADRRRRSGDRTRPTSTPVRCGP